MSKALRRFLELPETDADPNLARVSSHSLRATAPSWCSKFGLTEDERSVLGRHNSSVKTTQAIYSRDLCAVPTRKLQHIICESHEGRFLPDNKRSQHPPMQRTRALLTQALPQVRRAIHPMTMPRSRLVENPAWRRRKKRKSGAGSYIASLGFCMYSRCGKRLTKRYSIASFEDMSWTMQCRTCKRTL